MIVKAKISDAKTLSEIAMISKAYWGYTKEQLNSWIPDLTISENMISEMFVYKFISNQEIVGFYILNQPQENYIELEFLFVHPNCIGKGVGNQLIQHAFFEAKRLNCKHITVLSDPNAADFYKSKGFYEIDKKESSISGRFLPILQKDVN